MEFSVGDKVVYPNRGTGRVIGVEHRELVEGFRHYYVIKIPVEELTVHVPMRKTDDLGVRPVVSKTRLNRVLDVLSAKPRQLPNDYKERQEGVRQKLRTGRAIQIAEVVRDLTGHEQRRYLTKVDTDLLTQGRQFLAKEIALVTGDESLDVEEVIDTALAAAVPDEPGQQEVSGQPIVAGTSEAPGLEAGERPVSLAAACTPGPETGGRVTKLPNMAFTLNENFPDDIHTESGEVHGALGECMKRDG